MRTHDLTTLPISGVTFEDALQVQRLSFTDNSGVVKLGDYVKYTITGVMCDREFYGRTIIHQPGIKTGENDKFICYGVGYIASCVKVKMPPMSDSVAVTGGTAPISTYKIRFKGDGLTGGITIEQMLQVFAGYMSFPAYRAAGVTPQLRIPTMSVEKSVVYLVGGDLKAFFENIVKPAYPLCTYRFDKEVIEFVFTDEQPIHDIYAKYITSGSSLTANLMQSASTVVVESKSVDAIYDDAVDMTTYPETVVMPSFVNNNWHPGSLGNLNGDKVENIGLNGLHDQYLLRWTDAAGTPEDAIAMGGQDARMQVEKGPEGEAYDKYGWDMDAVLIVEELGKVQNTGWSGGAPAAGDNDVDYTESMENIAERIHDDISRVKYNGQIVLSYYATEIRPGDRVRLADHETLSGVIMPVSQVAFSMDGHTTLTLGEPGADYIAQELTELEMEKERRYYDIKVRGILSGGAGYSSSDVPPSSEIITAAEAPYTYTFTREGLASVGADLDQSFICPSGGGTIEEITIGARTTPSGQDVIVTLYEDGSPTGNTFILTASYLYEHTRAISIALTGTSVYTMRITQVGSTYAGESIYATILFHPINT